MIDDFKRPNKSGRAPSQKINADVFRPGQQEVDSSTDPLMPGTINPETPSLPKVYDIDLDEATPKAGKPAKKERRGPFWKNWSKKKKIITASILGVLILIIGAGIAWQLTKTEAIAPVAKKTVKKAPPPPPVYYSNLSGVKIDDPTINDRPVTGVMIENSPDSRPQSGIDQAGVVYEAIAEGGITRFLTLYQDTQPDYLGPVRSARPYYVQWARGYDAGYAHVGGSPEALANIKAWGIKDLDQFANSGAYRRISSRYAPHNVYTNVATLVQLQQQKGWTKSTYTGFERKDDTPSKAPTAAKIDVAISSALYNSHYDYDPTTNSYKRSQAGAPHNTINQAGTQAQINPKVVVTLVTGYSLSGKYSQYNVIGSGSGTIFQDGTATAITWKKDSIEAPLTFVDAAGKAVKINRGQAWITAISGPEKAVSAP